MKKELHCGFGRVAVNPPMGIEVSGYYNVRLADGILDDVEATAVALSLSDKTVLLITVDNCSLLARFIDECKAALISALGVDGDAVYIHSTHSHTAPLVDYSDNPLSAEYREILKSGIVEASRLAIADLAPAKMGYAVGQAPNIAFVRRFRMKDGSIRTNPGVNNPDIDHPIGDVDERVNVLRFTREGKEDIVIANFGNHPDTVGGCKISGDWPAFTRRIFEKAIDNTRCIFFNGAEGDVNHVNVNPKGGDLNDMFMDFDDVSRGYGHARHMGQVVAGAIMQVYDKVNYTEVDSIDYIQREIEIPSNMPSPEELPLAHKYNDLHNAGRDDEIPYEGMMLTTVVAEAVRMVYLENGPASFPLHFSAVRIGKVAFFGIPGEPFMEIGRKIKELPGWEMVLPTCNTNGDDGYFPTTDAYNEGGYEARSSNFKAGVAERIVEAAAEILSEIK